MKSLEVARRFCAANLHASAAREAQIVSRLGLHRFEQVVFALVEVEDNRTSRLQTPGRLEAVARHLSINIALWQVTCQLGVGLDFEKNSTLFTSLSMYSLPESAGGIFVTGEID